jgi:gliding motility-associated lipoprotein GldH
MKFLQFIVPAIMLIACTSDSVYKEYKKYDNLEWALNEPAVFTYKSTSDSVLRNVFFAFRYAQGFAFSKMLVLVTQTSPDGNKTQIPIAFAIKKADGSYIGDASGDIWDIESPIIKQLKMKKGDYTYSISYILPIQKLPLVMEVGLIIK